MDFHNAKNRQGPCPSADLSSFRALDAEDLHAPYSPERACLPYGWIEIYHQKTCLSPAYQSPSGPLVSYPKHPMDNMALSCLARNIITRLWNRFHETGHVQRWTGHGRPRATTINNDQYILLKVCSDRTANSTQIQRQFFLHLDEESQVKRSEIDFVRKVCMHVGFVYHVDTKTPLKDSGMLNIDIG
ncbi:hypothetical protein TNCV_4332591 [Trichonephila clavipes]|nr:hypothetical protein TNCV_4332591 [Trichonephila clavipes]